jgi:hypothetical protein
MKKLFVVILFSIGFASCQSSNGPMSGPVAMPKAGNQYTYEVSRPASNQSGAVQLQELASITTAANNIFDVSRQSDTINDFYTSTSGEQYQIFNSGDLWPWGITSSCDSTPLPIASHRSFISDSLLTPTKENGFVAMGSVVWHTRYDGEESVLAAGQTFECSKVEKYVTITTVSPNGGTATVTDTHVYWYSPAIQFFVKDQLLSSDSTGIVYTRTLTSYQLAN